MEITFFHWAYGADSSLKRSFAPLITELKKEHEVKEYSVPYDGGNPVNLIRNIVYVYKRRNRTGINHVTGDIHYCILGLIGVKSVLTIHDDYAMTQAKRGLDKVYKWLFWLYLPIRMADRVLCISPATKEAIDKWVRNNKTEMLYPHSIDSNYVYSKRQDAHPPILLQIGTAPHKNLETTLLAIKDLNVSLHVVRPMTSEQVTMAKELGIDFSNYENLSDEELVGEYRKSSIVLFPSLKEGFGMPIMEAQAVGRAVITSDLLPMSWVAGKNAVLLKCPLDAYELKDRIVDLLKDATLYHKTVKAGLENVNRFQVKNVAKMFVELYKSI